MYIFFALFAVAAISIIIFVMQAVNLPEHCKVSVKLLQAFRDLKTVRKDEVYMQFINKRAEVSYTCILPILWCAAVSRTGDLHPLLRPTVTSTAQSRCSNCCSDPLLHPLLSPTVTSTAQTRCYLHCSVPLLHPLVIPAAPSAAQTCCYIHCSVPLLHPLLRSAVISTAQTRCYLHFSDSLLHPLLRPAVTSTGQLPLYFKPN